MGFTWTTVSWQYVCYLISLVSGVFLLTAIANRFRLKPINLQEQFIMAYGGLRGAVSFSLVEMLEPSIIKPRQMFVTTTLAVILFTVFIQVRQPSRHDKCLNALSHHLPNWGWWLNSLYKRAEPSNYLSGCCTSRRTTSKSNTSWMKWMKRYLALYAILVIRWNLSNSVVLLTAFRPFDCRNRGNMWSSWYQLFQGLKQLQFLTAL